METPTAGILKTTTAHVTALNIVSQFPMLAKAAKVRKVASRLLQQFKFNCQRSTCWRIVLNDGDLYCGDRCREVVEQVTREVGGSRQPTTEPEPQPETETETETKTKRIGLRDFESFFPLLSGICPPPRRYLASAGFSWIPLASVGFGWLHKQMCVVLYLQERKKRAALAAFMAARLEELEWEIPDAIAALVAAFCL